MAARLIGIVGLIQARGLLNEKEDLKERCICDVRQGE